MSRDDEFKFETPVPLARPDRMPTDDVLKYEAGKLCMEYLQFWNPGEVEMTVILSRPDSKEAIFATSIQNADRLRHLLSRVRDEASMMKVLIKNRKPVI